MPLKFVANSCDSGLEPLCSCVEVLYAMLRTRNCSEEGPVSPASSSLCPARMLKHPTQQRSQLLVLSIREAVVQLALGDRAPGLAIKDVAQRAGVSNGSIYQYFQGVEGIVASTKPKPQFNQPNAIAMSATFAGANRGLAMTINTARSNARSTGGASANTCPNTSMNMA